MTFSAFIMPMMNWLIRVLTSIILALSSLGKLLDPTQAAITISQIFGVSYDFAKFSSIVFSFFEIGLAGWIWQRQVSRIVLMFPVMLLTVLIFVYQKGIDCGCFGSLPFFSQFSFGTHLLLLSGMFLSLYYLTTTTKTPKATPQAKDSQTATIPETPSWTGLAGVVMMLSTFLTLPFTSSDSRTFNHLSHDTVDRSAVETAIANNSAIIIDARPDFQYELGHLPGAINIPYDSSNLVELVNKHSLKSQALILYCSSAHCNAAELLAEKLHGLGCKKVSLYPGGWEAWERARKGEGEKG